MAMNMNTACIAAMAAIFAAAPANANELLQDPGFDTGEPFWGKFGAADFNDFFGGNPHASMFADGNGNFGGVFQTGISAVSGAEYTFSLTDVRIESNFNASFRFGLEFYAADDATKLSEQFFFIDSSDPLDGLITGDGLSYSTTITNDDAAAFVRPVILFDNAAPTQSSQANAFVFGASLTVVPAPASALMMAGGTVLAMRRRR